MRMYPRSEFPVHTFRPIVNARGHVSLAALAERFSAAGCPQASPAVAAAMIKAGCDSGVAISCAMLAYCAQECSMDALARTARAIEQNAEREHALRHPNGKCAEDMAARREGRASRGGTAEFHSVRS